MISIDTNKEQHYNSSCASVCVATLLSNYGLDVEDYDVIQESFMAYLVRYDKRSNMITAGIKMQTPDVFNLMLGKYQLQYKEQRCSNWTQFRATSDGLLEQGTPFMVGLKPKYLFETTRNADESKHAIVVYKKKKARYYIVNPVNRGVDCKSFTILPSDAMGKAVRCLGSFKIGYVVKTRKEHTVKLETLFKNSLSAIDAFQIKMEKLDTLINEKRMSEKRYMDYIRKFIKPIAMDLLTAVEATQNNSRNQKKLEMKLRDFQLFAREIQNSVKTNQQINMAGNTFLGYAKEIRLLFNNQINEMIIADLKNHAN